MIGNQTNKVSSMNQKPIIRCMVWVVGVPLLVWAVCLDLPVLLGFVFVEAIDPVTGRPVPGYDLYWGIVRLVTLALCYLALKSLAKSNYGRLIQTNKGKRAALN